jgi:PAS domain S-box-containing protein
LLDHEQILLGGAGLFDVSGPVSRNQWHEYIDRLSLVERYPGIQGVGFSKVILPESLSAHIMDMRREGFEGYVVKPTGDREFYTAIIYLEPFSDRNLAAFGYDMYSEPVRREAMRRAVNSNQTTITGKVTLVQETQGKEQAGFLMYVPVYYEDVPLVTEQDRWQALRGYVYSPYRMGDLMAGILGERDLVVDFKLHDGVSQESSALMYNSAADRLPTRQDGYSHQRTEQIEAYGQVWTLSVQSRPAFQSQFVTPLDWLVPVLGVGITLALFVLAFSILGRREQALALAEEMTLRRDESQERFRQLFFSLGQGVVISKANGQVFDANPAAIEILGMDIPRMQVTRDSFEDWPTLDEEGRDFPRSDHPDQVARRKGSPVTDVVMGIRHPTDNENWRWIKVDAFPSGSSADELQHQVFEVFTDITEQRNALLAVQRAEGLLSNVLEAASEVAIIATDPDGIITIFNKGAENMLGYRAAEMTGKRTPAILHDTLEVEMRSAELSAELGRPVGGFRVFVEKAEQEGSEKREWSYCHKSGYRIPVLLVVTTMRSNSGEITGYLGIAEDITERKRVDTMKNEFVSTVSHELRTPLTSISGALGLLVGGAFGDLPDRAQQMVATAHRNSQRLGYLINDLLDIEKLAAGQLNFDLSSQPIIPLVEQAIEANQAYGVARQVKLKLVGDTPDAQVQVDSQRLMQVMANLLSNAIKFSPQGDTVTVRVETTVQKVTVSVIDNGPGIAESFRGRIFQKFSQADGTDSRQSEGTGLGLAISRELMVRMGGSIDFESTEGAGSRFFFELPRSLPVSNVSSVVAHLENEREAPLILVVEDDPDVAQLLEMMLTRAGYRVNIATNGTEALSALHHTAYDLVSLDLELPGTSGLDVIRQMREQPELADTPIVVVSAKVEEGRLEITGDISAIDWLAKPIDQHRLIELVQKQLSATHERQPRVLHVEDDADLHQVVSAMLGDQVYLEWATGLKSARACLLREDYDSIILDIGLPDGPGWDLLPDIRSRLPDARIVILSGEDMSSHQAGRVEAVLLKSRVSTDELLAAIGSRIKNFRSKGVS